MYVPIPCREIKASFFLAKESGWAGFPRPQELNQACASAPARSSAPGGWQLCSALGAPASSGARLVTARRSVCVSLRTGRALGPCLCSALRPGWRAGQHLVARRKWLVCLGSVPAERRPGPSGTVSVHCGKVAPRGWRRRAKSSRPAGRWCVPTKRFGVPWAAGGLCGGVFIVPGALYASWPATGQLYTEPDSAAGGACLASLLRPCRARRPARGLGLLTFAFVACCQVQVRRLEAQDPGLPDLWLVHSSRPGGGRLRRRPVAGSAWVWGAVRRSARALLRRHTTFCAACLDAPAAGPGLRARSGGCAVRLCVSYVWCGRC